MPAAQPPPPTPDNLKRLQDLVLDPQISVIPLEIYRDASEWALQRLSRDFSTTYTLDSQVPWERQYLFVILAGSYLARRRAAQEATGQTISSTSAMSEIEVPNLRVQESSEELHGAEFWNTFADDLLDLYDGETGGVAPTDALPEVDVGVLLRHNRQTGGFSPRSETSDPSAPANFSAAVSGSDVVLSWDKVLGAELGGYEIYRDSVQADLNFPGLTQRIFVISDPHGWPVDGILYPRRTDEARPSGTWYYKICTIDNNGLRGFSAAVSATVP